MTIWGKVRRLTECVQHLIGGMEKQDAEIAELKAAHRALAQRLDNKTAELSKRIDKTEGIHGAR
jgi:hypothetical protein